MGITAAVIAGGAIAGGLMGGKKKTTSNSTTTQSVDMGPWTDQQGPVREGFLSAAQIKNAALERGSWEGPTTVGMNDTQRAAQGVLTDYASGTGAELARKVAGNADTLMAATPGYVNTAAQLAANGAGPANATAQGVLTGQALGQTAGPTAAGRIGGYATNTAMGNAAALSATGQGDGNAAIRSAADAYQNDPATQARIDASLRDVTRNFGEVTAPQLSASAIGGGNLNSSRAGAALAVAERGAMDRAADIAAGIRGQAYDRGLETATTVAGQQNALALGANSQLGSLGTNSQALGENQRQFNTGNAQEAARTLGSLDTANRALDANTRLSANNQQGNAADLGIQAAGAAGGLSDANAARFGAAGDALQQDQQRALTDQIGQFYRPQQDNTAALNDYWNVVGATNWGQKGTTVTQGTQTNVQPANYAGGAMGGAALAGSLVTGRGALAGTARSSDSGISGILSGLFKR